MARVQDYSEVSAFNRWAGVPPGDWRRLSAGT